MAFDLQGVIKQYEYLRDLAQTDRQASANGAAQSYATDLPSLINEVIRLSGLVVKGYELVIDIESELTHELDVINRRTAVAEWLESVRAED